jgi:hypothetical protein
MDGLFDAPPDDRVAKARGLWNEADDDLDDTPVSDYLRSIDGVRPPWPAALRYMPECFHGPTGAAYPALMAAIVDAAGRLAGIERTYLDDDGQLADVSPRRMLLGTCAGNAVHLGRHRRGEVLIVTESLSRGLRMHYAGSRAATWAALSAAGIGRLVLPDDADDILIAPTSEAGRKAAIKSAARWRAEGRRVRVVGGE